MRGALLIVGVLATGCQEYELNGPPNDVPPGDPPRLVVDPVAVDFGELGLGESASEVITVTNAGQGLLELDPLLLVDEAGAFEIVALDDWTLDSGEATDFVVSFVPLEPGPLQAVVTVASDAPQDAVVDVDLAGVGGQPPLYDVDIMLTADNAWDAWVDGVEVSGAYQDDWTHSDTLELELEAGDHVIAVHARDQSAVISGLIAIVSVDGVDTWLTGDAPWRMTAAQPASDWSALAFDDSTWSDAVVCDSQSSWGTYWPADFYAAGAEWIWWTSNCRDLAQAWFRLSFTL